MPVKTWTDERHQALLRLYPNHSIRYCAEQLGLTYESVKSRVDRLKLLHAPGYNRMANSVIALTEKERDFIARNYKRLTNHELAKRIGRSESAIQSVRRSLGITKENEGRFKPGIIPVNKGKKMPLGWGGETRFKKGLVPHNTKSDGHMTVRYSNGRPYIWVRVKINIWQLLHRVIWEKTIGTIPAGCNVQFKDGNPLNCDPSNLYLITRDKQMLQNSIQRYTPEVKSLIRLTGKLKRKIKQYEKQA